MGHFEDLEDLGLKTSVSVLGIRPGLRSELKTLDRLAPAQVVRVYKSLFTERRGGSTYQFRQTVNQPDTNRQTNERTEGRTDQEIPLPGIRREDSFAVRGGGGLSLAETKLRAR